MDFYGKRHESYDIEQPHITWDMLNWELLFLFNYNAGNYFLTNLGIDLDEDTLKYLMVSVTAYDYTWIMLS